LHYVTIGIFGAVSSSICIYDLSEFNVVQKYNLDRLNLGSTTRITCYLNDQVIISDEFKHCIHLVLIPRTNDEKLLTKSFSPKGDEDGKVNYPRGIITQYIVIWVVDSGNHRIQKFSIL